MIIKKFGALALCAALLLLAAACGEKVDYLAKAESAAKRRDWPAAFELAGKAVASGAYRDKKLAQAYYLRAQARVGRINRSGHKDPAEYREALLPVGRDAARATAADPKNLGPAELFYGMVAVVTSMETMQWFRSQPREAVSRGQLADYREGLARKYIRDLQAQLGPELVKKAAALFEGEETAHQKMRRRILGQSGREPVAAPSAP